MQVSHTAGGFSAIWVTRCYTHGSSDCCRMLQGGWGAQPERSSGSQRSSSCWKAPGAPSLTPSSTGLLSALVVQSLSQVCEQGTALPQASLSSTISQSLLKLMSIESVMPSNHLILCHPLLFLPSIFPSIRVFSNESALWIRWPNCWSFCFSVNE